MADTRLLYQENHFHIKSTKVNRGENKFHTKYSIFISNKHLWGFLISSKYMDSKIESERAKGRKIAQNPMLFVWNAENGERLKCAPISSMAWKFRKIEKCSLKSALNIHIYYTWNSWQQYVEWKCVYHAHTQVLKTANNTNKLGRSSLHNKFICTKSVSFVGRYT